MDPGPWPGASSASRLPRLRGDGPQEADRERQRAEAPPPTRGWTLLAVVALDFVRGSPAYAGMDLIVATAPSGGSWLPRLRGDGPAAAESSAAFTPAPPPTRGWTPVRQAEILHRPGSPAYAGMDPHPLGEDTIIARLPRLRGDGPCRVESAARRPPAPPPTRGWTPCPMRRRCARNGSPAYAGMDPTFRRRQAGAAWLPRLRGDGPTGPGGAGGQGVAPPPTRGWTAWGGKRVKRYVGSPAYAGMDLAMPCGRRRGSRLPRLRGDGPISPSAVINCLAAPPPTRGWTRGW